VRNEMFAHHHVQRELLSVRERMTDIVARLADAGFVDFVQLFAPREGRMGVAVTFIAILELVREGLIDIVQQEPFAPIHVRAALGERRLRVVADNSGTEAVLEAETVAVIDDTRAPTAGMELPQTDDDEPEDDADDFGS
jgi:hypothetical protein